MNVTTEVKNRTGTAQEIADAINADPKFWNEIRPATVAAWNAKGTRGTRLKAFAASIDLDNDSEALLQIKNALGTMFETLNVPGQALDSSPTSDQGQLIRAVATLGIPGIDATAVGELLATARPSGWVDVTAADVTKAQLVNASQANLETATAALRASYQTAIGEIDAGTRTEAWTAQ